MSDDRVCIRCGAYAEDCACPLGAPVLPAEEIREDVAAALARAEKAEAERDAALARAQEVAAENERLRVDHAGKEAEVQRLTGRAEKDLKAIDFWMEEHGATNDALLHEHKGSIRRAAINYFKWLREQWKTAEAREAEMRRRCEALAADAQRIPCPDCRAGEARATCDQDTTCGSTGYVDILPAGACAALLAPAGEGKEG